MLHCTSQTASVVNCAIRSWLLRSFFIVDFSGVLVKQKIESENATTELHHRTQNVLTSRTVLVQSIVRSLVHSLIQRTAYQSSEGLV